MATFAEKYRKGGSSATGSTSFADRYRKNAAGEAPLGNFRDEQAKVAKKIRSYKIL